MNLLGIDLAKPSLYWLFPLILITIIFDHYFPSASTTIFFLACLSIIPLAALLSEATNEIAVKSGDAVGGFLNATFGNATEFIIAIVALNAGKIVLVKATLTGAIIGNILLVLGLSFLAGGIKHKVQKFNRLGAESLSIGMTIAVIALIIPSAYQRLATDTPTEQYIQLLSNSIAVLLLVVYLSSIFFSLYTHRKLIAEAQGKDTGHGEALGWSIPTAILILFVAAALIALMSEVLVKHVEHAAEALGMSKVFVGVIIVAIVGNAAEHSTAVIMAVKNRLDISINIAIGSSIQIALFIVPVLVLLSAVLPISDMDLIFSRGQILLILLGTFIVSQTVSIGESTWYKGVQLLSVYIIIAIALYFVH